MLWVDDSNDSVDLIDLDLGALLDYYVGGVGTGRPTLPVHLDLTARFVDLGDGYPATADHLVG